MGQRTDNQKSQDALLRGVIEAPYPGRATVTLITGTQYIVVSLRDGENQPLTFDRLCEALNEPGDWLELVTFTWTGSRMQEQTLYALQLRKSEIASVTQVTDSMWKHFITDQASRAAQASRQQSGLAVPSGPGGMG